MTEPERDHVTAGTLDDGSAPASPERLFERLRALDIAVTTVEHPPAFTVEEARALRGNLEGGHSKNLFLRDKKGKMWLVVCREDLAVDLKKLPDRIGAGRLSFGSADRLMRYLGVIPGAVTPFAVINDHGGAVRVVVDRELLALRPLHFHPLDNARTTAIEPGDLLRFLEAEGHAPSIVDL